MNTPRSITLFEDRTEQHHFTALQSEEMLGLIDRLWGKQNYTFHADGRLLLRKYVGFVATPTLQLQILPKIFSDSGQGTGNENIEAAHLLFRMLHYTGFMNMKEIPDPQKITSLNGNILEIFISIFVHKLMALWNRNRFSQYEPIEENAPYIKGKVLFQQSITRDFGLRHRHHIRYDEFTTDTLLNRIFRSIVQRLLQVSQTTENQQQLKLALLAFEDVQLISLSKNVFEQVKFTRLNELYRPVFELARMFYSNAQPGLRGGDETTFTFLVPLNELFEKTVYQMVREGYEPTGYLVRYQGPRLRLDVEAKSVLLKPDITVQNREGTGSMHMIIDAKYKDPIIYNEMEPSVSDLYQMLTYAVRYKCDTIVMVYPKFRKNGNDGNNDCITIDNDGRIIRIRLLELDLFHADIEQVEKRFVAELREE